MIIAGVDLNLLEEQCINGTVLPLNDLIRDAYDRVVHFCDRPSDKDSSLQLRTTESQTLLEAAKP